MAGNEKDVVSRPVNPRPEPRRADPERPASARAVPSPRRDLAEIEPVTWDEA